MTTRNLFNVAITALTGGAAGQVFALTSANEVYDVSAPGMAVYRSGNRVNDIAFGTVDLASFLIFGDGCGSTVVPPHQATSGVPSVGNAGFSIALVGGQPQAAAFFVFGGSRTTFSGFALPQPLDFLQMPRCWLYSDIIVLAGLSLNAAGNASLPLAIPNAGRLRGTHFTTQWFTADGAANPLGLAASDGAEGIIR